MKLLILGGGGFLGSAICDRLLASGHALRVFERPRVPPYRDFRVGESVEWVTGDFASRTDMAEAIRGVEGVVHLISTTLPKSSNDDPVYDVQSNVVGTLQLLDAMREQKLERIVFISSGGTVYGIPQTLPIDERHPTDPVCSYGISKLMIEKHLLMRERLQGLKPVVLRVANPYGERQRIETAQGAVAAFLHRAMTGQPIEVWGDGTVTRDYIYVGDVAEAFALALSHDGPGRVFNVSSGQGLSLNQLIELIAQALGTRPEVRYLPGRPFDVPTSILDNALAREALGWAPRVSMAEGLERTIDWIRSGSASHGDR